MDAEPASPLLAETLTRRAGLAEVVRSFPGYGARVTIRRRQPIVPPSGESTSVMRSFQVPAAGSRNVAENGF